MTERMNGGRVAWCRQSSHMISMVLSALTCIMAYSYWSISQDYVILENKVRICNQKEVDFAGVAAECKKRVTELHDKISVLTSDKEVLATQKNSLQEYNKHNLEEIKEFKSKANVLQAENERLIQEKESEVNAEKAKVQESQTFLKEQTEKKDGVITELRDGLKEANDKITALESSISAGKRAEGEPPAEVKPTAGGDKKEEEHKTGDARA